MQTTHTRARLAACAALAALGLAPLTAHAQSLTLGDGDIVTVSSAGTHGTINNTATSYNDSTSIPYAARINGTAAFTLGTGGSLTAYGIQHYGLIADGSGPVTVSGGAISAGPFGVGLVTSGTGTVTVTGGTITAGTNGYGLSTVRGGTINLFSLADSPFTVTINGVMTQMNNTALPTDSTNGVTGSISGTLLNGDKLDTTFLNYSTINLNVAPEPSQFAGLGIGLLGLAGLAFKARKRTA